MQMVRVCLVVADGRESLMGRRGEVIDLAGASWVLESMIVKRDGPFARQQRRAAALRRSRLTQARILNSMTPALRV